MGPEAYYQPPTAQKVANGPDKKFIYIVAGCILAVIIGIVFLIFNGDSDGQKIARAVDGQNELVAFCNASREGANTTGLGKINIDAELFFSTDAQELVAIAAKNGGKANTEAELSEEDVAKLEAATADGTFSAVYKEMFEQRLDAQQALLREIYGEVKGQEAQAELNDAYEHVEIIRKQLSAT